MTDKLSRPTLSHAALWHILLAFADFRIPKPVTELMVFPACIGKPAYYVCPRCKITMEREFMSFCDRCGQRLDWRSYRHAKIIYPGSRFPPRALSKIEQLSPKNFPVDKFRSTNL